MKTSSFDPSKQTKLSPSWDLVGPSWRLLVQHFEPIIFLFVLPSLVLVLGGLLLGDTTKIHHLADISQRQRTGIGLLAVGLVWSLLNSAPSFYFRVKVTAGKAPGLSECYRRGLPYFWRLAGVNIFLGLLLFIGILLFVVPGVVLLILFLQRYYLVNYYLIDRDLSIKQALQQSRQETAPVAGAIWGTVGVQITFSLIAASFSVVNRVGAVPAIFVQLICLFVPVLRYQEIKRTFRSKAT